MKRGFRIIGIVGGVILTLVGCVLLLKGTGILNFSFFKNTSTVEDRVPQPKHLLNPGDVFTEDSYIEVADVRILYNGEQFYIQNKSENIIRVLCSIVGTKKDETYEVLQLANLAGVDQTQYEKDMHENGWAIKHMVNLVRPGGTLKAELEVVDFGSIDSDYPNCDVDGDGYWDILFTICPQVDEEQIMTSSSDPKSEVYRLRVK